jgi:hypothetical protein
MALPSRKDVLLAIDGPLDQHAVALAFDRKGTLT